MKKNKKVLILILSIMIVIGLTINVWAAKGSFSLTKSNVTLTEGQSTSFDINATECEGQFTISSSNTDVVKVNKSSVWVTGKESITLTAGKAGNAKITIKASDVADTDENSVGGSKTIDVTVKSNSTPPPTTPPPSTPAPTDEPPVETNPSTGSTGNQDTTPTKSSNNQLKSLKVNQGTLSPSFSARTKEYTVDVGEDVESIKITATKSHSKATVSGDGTKQLNPGSNVFEIAVTAENGSVNTYKITVNKPEKQEEVKEPELKLSSLNVKGVNTDRELVELTYSPEFSEEIYEYEMEVEENIEELTIEALAKEEGMIVEVSGNENLVVGENIVTIIVKTQDESKSAIYQIIIYKKAPKIAEAVLATPEELPEDISKSDYWILIACLAGIVALIIIGTIVIVIMHRKKVKENMYTEVKELEIFEEPQKSKKRKKNEDVIEEDESKGKGKGRHF